MALEALGLEDGADVALEGGRVGRSGRADGGHGDAVEKADGHDP